MLCNHDTDFFLETIISARGRRYNQLPSGADPLVGRNISRDDVAGFFHVLKLNEQHVKIVRLVNTYQVADREMIIEHTGLKFKKYREIMDECIMHGLVYENNVKTEFKGSVKEYYWYFIDTGGIYVLEALEEKYKPVPFTVEMADRYKLYLKSRFLFYNREFKNLKNKDLCKTKEGKVYQIELIEDVIVKNVTVYKDTIFLVNLETLKLLNINKEVKSIAIQLNHSGNRFYDVSSKNFLDLRC